MAGTHAIERTSRKGSPFYGTCFKCGKEGLPMAAASWACENPANLTADEALVVAVQGPSDSGGDPQGEKP